jgi:colicin import membrane protein
VDATLPARDLFAPREPEGRGRGIALSLLIHAGLVVAIAFGVSWRSRTPEAQQAELWAAVPQAAAARAVEPEPVPLPEAKAPPKVETPPPPAAQVPAPVPDAQIAIERARADKARREREAADLEREAQRKKLEAEKLAREKQAAEKVAAEKVAAEKAAADKRLQREADERQAQQRRAEWEKNLQRKLGQEGATGEPGATGTALRSTGPSASYAGRIIARVRPNLVFVDDVAGNPTAEVEVRAASDGTIVGRKLVKSSGVPAYDNAVLRAIDKTEVLPRDVDGRVPSALLLVFRLRD